MQKNHFYRIHIVCKGFCGYSVLKVELHKNATVSDHCFMGLSFCFTLNACSAALFLCKKRPFTNVLFVYGFQKNLAKYKDQQTTKDE